MINFRKVSAVLTSAVMIVSSLGMAAAANYPSPFTATNVGIVYGANGASTDAIAAGNIQSNLDSLFPSTGGSSTVSGGDSVLIAKASDNLNLGNMWSIFTGTVDDGDLSTLLADGTYIAGDNDEFKYEQTITLGAPNLTHFRDSDYEDLVGASEDTPAIGFKISSSTFIMNYTLDFTSDAETDIDTNSRAEDIEGSTLPLFGKEYYVSRLNNASSGTTFFGTLTLLDSANTATVTEGETVTVAGYQVSIQYIDSDEVRFTIDGTTYPSNKKLGEGDSTKIGEDTYIGVTSIDKLEVSGETGSVTFSIGSGKLEITSGSELKLNDDTISGVKGYVYMGTPSSNREKIDKIVIDWTTDEEVFLSSETELSMPGFEAIKFTMGDFVRSPEEMVKVAKETDTNVEITVPIKDGKVSFPLLYANASGEFSGIGKSATERLATSANDSIKFYEKITGGAEQDRYFVATYNTTTEAESYLLRATVTQDNTDGRNETTISKNVDGSWEVICDGTYVGKSCSSGLGSVSLTIDTIQYTSGGEEFVVLQGSEGVNFNTIFTDGGLGIYLPYVTSDTTATGYGAVNVTNTTFTTAGHSSASFYLYMDGENKEDTLAGGQLFYFTIDDTSTGNLQVSQVNGAGSGGANGLEVGDGTGIYEAYIVDDVAPRILHYTNPDEDYVEVYYPTGDSESYAEVYVAESSAVVSGGVSQLGGIVIKDDEISTVQTNNLIVVGGSCINSVAAELLGGAYCSEEFTTKTSAGSGEFIIQSFNNPYTTGKIALLVAGYDAADTSNAQKFLTGQTVNTAVGTKYIGTSATSAEKQ